MYGISHISFLRLQLLLAGPVEQGRFPLTAPSLLTTGTGRSYHQGSEAGRSLAVQSHEPCSEQHLHPVFRIASTQTWP